MSFFPDEKVHYPVRAYLVQLYLNETEPLQWDEKALFVMCESRSGNTISNWVKQPILGAYSDLFHDKTYGHPGSLGLSTTRACLAGVQSFFG